MFKRNPLLIVHLNSDTGIPPIPVFEKRFTVGRKPTHLVSIPDNSISRDHVEIVFRDGQLYVMDLGTSNGTAIGGQHIPSNIPTPYQQGKIVTLGKSNVHLTIEIFEEDREKRKNNPSLKAIQQFNSQHTSHSHSHHESTKPEINNHPIPATAAAAPASSNTHSQSHNSQASHSHPSHSHAPHSHESSINIKHDSGASVQTREDANRILAKAKIEAEIAAKDLMKNKETEAQKIVIQAEARAMDKIKEAEHRGHTILEQAQSEAQKLKNEKLDEARAEKERILALTQIEKETLLRDIDSLKKTIPALTTQIDQLKIQTQRFQAEKNSAETLYSQEQLRLEKLQTEIKNQELKVHSLLQQLDINQRKVQDAEEKYNKTVQANQTLIEDTKNALQRAQEKELEFQALVAKAKSETESAIKYAQDQRSDADSYSKVMKEEADLFAKNLREKTELWEREIREKTETEINTKFEILKQENEKIIQERETQYQETRAKQEAVLEELRATENLKLKNLQDIDSILKQKEEDFESSFSIKRNKLESDYKERQKMIEDDLRSQRESIERELTDRRTSIERELLERREILERESAEKKSQIENEAQELRALRDKEYKELKMQQDAYLFDIKKREEDRLKAMVDESRRLMREKYEHKNDSVQKTFAEFFAGYSSIAPSAIKDHLPELENKLKTILKEALLSENIGEDKQLKQLFEYDPSLEKKHKKFWIYTAAASILVAITLGAILMNPKSITKSADTITEIVHDIDQEAKKAHTERMEQIRKASIFNPTKDDKFKSSYTDNIIYTNRYLEFERDEQYRSQWIVSTKEFLIQEVKLLDDIADEILSKEGTLIIALSSETIDGQKPEKGIARMSAKEAEFNQFLIKYLNPDKQKALFEKKQAFYERFISDPSKIRTPAAN